MATCPICRRQPAVEAYKPFCSKRCADVDLQRWFTGGYVIPEDVDELPLDERDED
ncbi:DNA gyrase inhibitor YacG [Brevundimonas sp. UBA2416]|uniref:DNA gyrase inhibitor YacG n=1 Tax=Brevundimonas sp. UBA2416 TaxID=1946124 RepID=UPI0025BBD80C|nr:DNA gyrase inhibitor YacG [Brevundimonas sp. UBA2416]HRJ64976.1 DNA gyrase inhibitor YacG [Brevundimonas sp.]